jgi:predicted metalloprotease
MRFRHVDVSRVLRFVFLWLVLLEMIISGSSRENVMRWKDERRSENVEDQRRIQPAGIVIGGGIGTLILALVAIYMGADPRAVLNVLQNQQQNVPAAQQRQAGRPVDPAEEERVDFVKAVLGSTEDVWKDLFKEMNLRYDEPKLDLFTGRVNSACGLASAAVGPFYCPADQKVYIDLSFYKQLKDQFKAPGEFAEAYVIAHEIGHHVQNLLGLSEKVHAQQQRATKAEANKLSVMLELQADFLAGVWANHAQSSRKLFDPSDIDDGIRAAAAIGDDRLQLESQGYVRPDSFTHGSSEQRVRWFRKGFKTGDINQGDTFSAPDL